MCFSLLLANDETFLRNATARLEATLHLVSLNFCPDESLHHTLQHMYHLLKHLLLSLFRAPYLPVYKLTIKLSSNTVGIQPSYIMTSMRSRTLTTPAYLTGFSISATNTDGPTALSEAIMLMAFLIISVVIGSLRHSTWHFSYV